LIEEHRDPEVLDHVELARRVEARLQEFRVEVLDVRDEVEVELQEPAFLDQLAHRVLARDDDVVTRAAGVQLGEELVVRRVVRLVDLEARRGLVGERCELLVGRGVVVLRPVVDDEGVLERLALERVGGLAGAAVVPSAGVRAATAAGGRKDGEPTEAERGPAAHPHAGEVLHLAVQVVELRPHRARREEIQMVAGFVGHAVASVVSASPSMCGAASSQLTAIWSPGWMVSRAGSALARCSRTTTLVPFASVATTCTWSPRYIFVTTSPAALLAVPSGCPGWAAIRSGRMPMRTRLPRWASPRPRITTPEPASTAKPPSPASTTSPSTKFMSPMKSATNGVSGRS